MNNEVKLAGLGQETISEIVRKRIEAAGKKYFCNDNISEFVSEEELNQIQNDVEKKIKEILEILVIDINNDHNTNETAKRVAKMFVQEIFEGRYSKKPNTTAFPNVRSYDELYVVGPITVRSMCAHHLMPIKGNVWIGVFPGNNVIGLSKFNRLVNWVCSRPQIQEEMTYQIADLIEEETQADGIAVIMKANHFCMTHRGVKEHHSDMTTSVMKGYFREKETLKQEFLTLVNNMKGNS